MSNILLAKDEIPIGPTSQSFFPSEEIDMNIENLPIVSNNSNLNKSVLETNIYKKIDILEKRINFLMYVIFVIIPFFLIILFLMKRKNVL